MTPVTGGNHWWHSGGASGTRNLLARRVNGKSWVVLMNSRPQNEDQIIEDLFDAFRFAETQVTSWPSHDLFNEFVGPTLAASAETLTFTHSFGSASTIEPQTVHITATPNAANLTVDPPTERWLRVDRLGAVTPASFAITADPAGLAVGEYRTQLRITAPGALNGPRIVRITLRIVPPPALAGMRNTASQLPVRAAAPASRLTLEGEDLADATVRFTSGGEPRSATIVQGSATRLDVLVPFDLAHGDATVSILTTKGRLFEDAIRITPLSPALFSANRDGKGVALAVAIRTAEDGAVTESPAYQCGEEPGSCAPAPIDLGAGTGIVKLRLEATGVRSQTDPAAFAVKIGDEAVEVVSVQASESTPGVDLITVTVPPSLTGRGEVDVTLTVGEETANSVKLAVQ
jgi:uncharacterized protein (TIGR03437 family)